MANFRFFTLLPSEQIKKKTQNISQEVDKNIILASIAPESYPNEYDSSTIYTKICPKLIRMCKIWHFTTNSDNFELSKDHKEV